MTRYGRLMELDAGTAQKNQRTLQSMTLEEYLKNRRRWEILAWIALLTIGFAAQVGVEWLELNRLGQAFSPWHPIVLEGTSHIAVGVTIPLLLWFERRVPIRIENWRRDVAAHAVFTVLWSLTHVSLMYGARVVVFDFGFDTDYRWDDWWIEFGYEYLKDFRTYFFILALVYLYRFVLRRARGEAGFLSEGEEDTPPTPVADRLLIKKLGREFLVRTVDIDWVEASGNYVNLHVGKSVYPLRETMNGISERLREQGFQRVHRSAAVNLDRVREIVAFDSGDGEARLIDDVTVPISRRFKKALKERLS